MTAMAIELWRVSMPFATFGIESTDGKVVRAAPIAGWSVGRPVIGVLDYYRQRKGKVALVPDDIDPLPGLHVPLEPPATTGLAIIVCGGRNFSDRDAVFSALDTLHARPGGVALVIQGGASGADLLAAEWCDSRRVACVTMEADWDREGKAAGPIRNRAMLAKLTTYPRRGVVGFSGGRGTADMCRAAVAAGVKVWTPRSETRQ
jgi:SLOG family YspA-like protein